MENKLHNRSCWCEPCWWFKLENPEIVERIDDFRTYAEETLKQQEGEVRTI